MGYHLIYDIAEQPFPWWIVAVISALFVGGVIHSFVPSSLLKRHLGNHTYRRYFGIVFLLALVGLAGPALFQNLSIRNDLQELVRTGDFSVVEGAVENFSPMPYTGGGVESFTVKGVLFEYSDYDARPGFNNTQSHGGPISAGLRVRISYSYMPRWRKNVILRLETKQ